MLAEWQLATLEEESIMTSVVSQQDDVQVVHVDRGGQH